MIGKLTKCAATIGLLLASALPAAAFEKTQTALWASSEKPIAVVGATDLFAPVRYEAGLTTDVVTLADSRGVNLNPYIQIAGNIIDQEDKNALFSQAAMDGRGIGLNVVYAALDDGANIERELVEGWGNSFQSDRRFGEYAPTLDSATAYNPKILFDGRGVGLQQASLSTNTLFSTAIAAVEIGNF